MLRIQVAGVTILGRPNDFSSRVEGLFVGPDGFEGWDDGPETRRESIDRPGQHGEFDLPVFNGSRVISIDGHALAWSDVELDLLRNRVMGIAADGARTRLTVEHRGSSLWADVRRGARPTFRDAGIRSGMMRAKFAIHLVAADPRKYGEEHEFPAGAVSINRGNFPATPQHLVTGTSGTYTINGPGGKKFIVSSGPGSGTDRIDMASGRVYRNGVLQLGVTSRADLWAVPPGLPGVTHTITAGSLVTRLPDTFV